MEIPSGWSINDSKLTLEIKYKDFNDALTLLRSVGDIAEKLQHHPDLGVRDYNQVFITTTTHDANSLTKKDYELAQEINDLIASRNG